MSYGASMGSAREIAAAEGVHPVSRAEYDRLVALDFFGDARVELLYGVVVPMSPQKAPHATTVAKITRRLSFALDGRAEVRSHSPFAASGDSEPEPDVIVAPLGDYDEDHPATAHLLVEVAESSLRRDRGPKWRLYAETVVPEYWIVDLGRRVVEVWRDPRDGEYRSLVTLGEGDALVPLAFPDVHLSIVDLLPRKKA